jgi:nucleoside 2-deoxyribosyltransferase/predicted transcriptional regulator
MMKKYSEMSEQELVQAIAGKIGRGVEVRFTPIVIDPNDFTPKKMLLVKHKDRHFKINVSFKPEHAQDESVRGALEEYFSNFVNEVVADFERQLNGKRKVYLASGWFNPTQESELTQLEKVFDDRADWIELASPRRIFICPPDAPKEVQDGVFSGNLHHIETADFLLVNTRDKDIGTIWESGYGFAHKKPIVYFCNGLPAGAKFNLMLARSGIKVCTSFDQLVDYLDRCKVAGEMLVEPYSDNIE